MTLDLIDWTDEDLDELAEVDSFDVFEAQGYFRARARRNTLLDAEDVNVGSDFATE